MQKFYCKKCNQIKSRHKIKLVDHYYHYGYECRYCHEEVEPLDEMLLRLNKAIETNHCTAQLNDLHDWIRREAQSRYKGHPAEKEAFKDGIYALLDKINFKHGENK